MTSGFKLEPREGYPHLDHDQRILPGLSVGCCFRGFVPDEQTEFFRAAAMNRGLRTEFLQDLNMALRWLGAGR
jgi:hypothetical protein